MNLATKTDKHGGYVGRKLGELYNNYFERREVIKPFLKTVKELNLEYPTIIEIGTGVEF